MSLFHFKQKLLKVRILAYYSFLLLHLLDFTLAEYANVINDDHLQSPLDPDSDESYLRLTWSNGTEYYIRHWECPDGIWSEDYLVKNPPKCACVKGAFIATKGLCDNEFEILTGNEHCYDISKSNIRKFTPLTGQSGLNGRASTVFRKDAPYVARLISPTPKINVDEPMNYVFRLNDPNDFSVYASLPNGAVAKLGCLEGQKVTSPDDPIMQVAELPKCATSFRGPQDWCGNDTTYEPYKATIKVGSKWGPKSSGSGQLYPGGCGGGGGKSRGRREALKEKHSDGKPLPNCEVFDPILIEYPEQGKLPPVEHFVDREEYPTHEFHTPSLHQTEVNDQTLNVVKNIVDIHLGVSTVKNSSRVKINTPDAIPAFRFLQLSRLIFQRVCPQTEIPSFVITFITRVFRLIHLDIAHKYPYPEKLENGGATNARILEALTTCNDKIPFNITNFIKNDTCPDAGYLGTNMTSGGIYLYDRNMTRMPENIRFDPSTMDMALETVWKMGLFVHYYCSPNFTNPLYHSEFMVKFEAFFNNPALLYRWYHPGPANTVLKTILAAFNLRGFADAIDRCVTTANAMSAYKGWLKRPADSLTWKPRYEGEKEEVLSRKKRYYFQNNIWDEKAYCLRNSKDVSSEVQSSALLQCVDRPTWFQNTD